ncbi:hypothetical protein WN982_22175 [Paraburkholderia sp. IMGN_8]
MEPLNAASGKREPSNKGARVGRQAPLKLPPTGGSPDPCADDQ